MGCEGEAQGQFDRPWGVAMSGEEIFVTDCDNDRIQVFTLDGDFLRMWGSEGDGPGQFNHPRGIADL